MNKIKIKYLYISLLALFAMASCDDIVTYNDNYDDGMTSTGAPVINAIYDSEDTEYTTPLASAVFEQMLVITGDNLAQVKKIMFNDVEMQLSEVYATREKAFMPVPRQIPENVTNKIVYETELGSTTFDFTVNIPEVKVEGLYYEFCQPGDTVQIVGDYFDLYGFGGETETSTIKMNGQDLKVDSISEGYIAVVIPEDAQPNSVIDINYEGLNGSVHRQVSYMNTAGLVWSKDFVKNYSYPEKVSYVEGNVENGEPDYYINLKGDFKEWDWIDIIKSKVKISPEVAASPGDYLLKFDVCSAENTPFYNSGDAGGYRFVFNTGGNTSSSYAWNPSSITSFGTYGKWRTISLDLVSVATKIKPLTEGETDFDFVIHPNSNWTVNHSFANFRIEKKLP